MIVLALGMVAFAVADLVRFSPGPVSRKRTIVSVFAGALAAGGLAALAGIGCVVALGAGAAAVGVLAVWTAPVVGDGREEPVTDEEKRKVRLRAGLLLVWIGAVTVSLFALSGVGDPVAGPLQRWYEDLDLSFTSKVPVDQFVLAFTAVLFLLATANRVVRHLLEAAQTSPVKGESRLPGGRLLGPMERLIVAATVLAGDPAGAALVIAAKGLLRLPEVRRSDAEEGEGDADAPASHEITEYFLIGTFSSLLLAGLVALLVLADG